MCVRVRVCVCVRVRVCVGVLSDESRRVVLLVLTNEKLAADRHYGIIGGALGQSLLEGSISIPVFQMKRLQPITTQPHNCKYFREHRKF